MAEPPVTVPVSTRAEDWVAAALKILVEEGAAEVKILTLADRLGCSRSNFYWFFKDREALLAALMAHWQGRNTRAITDRAGLPVKTIAEGVLNIFDCWADPALFDAKLDFAVREWSRRSGQVADELRRADASRVAAIEALFRRCGFAPEAALVRARTLYFMQIGYYAVDVQEGPADRLALLSDYVQAFCGQVPSQAEMAAFRRRNAL